MAIKNYLFLLGLSVILFACPAKTTEEAQSSTQEEQPEDDAPVSRGAVVEEELSPCPKFSDAPDPDAIETEYVLYRDFLKANDWEGAFEKWQKVYAVAPAADGKRNSKHL